MKTLIYPFDRQFLPLIRHQAYPSELEIEYCVAPNGWGFSNKDIGIFDLGEPVGKRATSDFDGSLEQCEAVIICKWDKFLRRDIVYDKLIKSANAGKHIYCCIDLNLEEYEYVYSLVNEHSKTFTYYNTNLDSQDQEILAGYSDSILQIDTPVIMVFGIMEQVSKFDTQLALRQYLKDLGYSVSVVSSRTYGAIAGFHPTPFFLLETDIPEAKKVSMLNGFIKNIELNEKPDLIIIGVPGGILPIDDKISNGFGITGFEVTQAVTPDVAIVNIPHEQYAADYFQELDNIVKYRFSSLSNAYLVDNVFFDRSSQPTPDQYSMLQVDEDLELDLSAIRQPIFRKNNREELFRHVIDALASNAENEIY